jgi:hypothetical protein
MPYFGATEAIFSNSSGVGGDGFADGSATRVPVSSNIFSMPAGATRISIRASAELSFLKVWRTPLGTFKKDPLRAITFCPSATKVISPSST